MTLQKRIFPNNETALISQIRKIRLIEAVSFLLYFLFAFRRREFIKHRLE